MRPFAFLALCFAATAQTNAQYVATWPTQPAIPLANSVQPGDQVLRISNVNDFLYSYDINVVETTSPLALPQLPTGGATVEETCTDTDISTFVSKVTTAKAAYDKLIPTSATPPITLATTQGDWAKNVKPSYSAAQSEYDAAKTKAESYPQSSSDHDLCTEGFHNADQVYSGLKKADQQLNNQPHALTIHFTARSCKSETISILEKLNAIPTGQSMTIRLDAECNAITASGGVLMSEIQNRTYTPSPSPTASGNFLAVGGTGRFQPTIATLFNFNAPSLGSWTRHWGDLDVGISTGPILQINSSQTSAFGWLGGGTVSVLHYLYLTAGEHFGQFADYPLGFSRGEQIPSGFGALTPIKRWTGRFGFAITIKGWNVSKAISGGTDSPKTSTTNTTPQPKQ